MVRGTQPCSGGILHSKATFATFLFLSHLGWRHFLVTYHIWAGANNLDYVEGALSRYILQRVTLQED